MTPRAVGHLFKAFLFVFCLSLAVLGPGSVFAQTYDITARGVPKFVDTVYIDLHKITKISKFRSGFGHDYSDTGQFNLLAYVDPALRKIEGCSSMKHYFMAPDESAAIYAPVSGTVTRMFDEEIGGTQIQIAADAQPAFTFTMFHVTLEKPLTQGDHVSAGQRLGHHVGTQTWSDIAVIVRTPKGLHLVSYFETLTDEAFAAFKARGVESRSQMILSRAYRDANPVFYCATGAVKPVSDTELFVLSGGAKTQSIKVLTFAETTVHVGDAPVSVAATASSGLPVVATSQTPKVCAVTGTTLSWRRPGRCMIVLSQAGNTDFFAAPTLGYDFTVLARDALPVADSMRIGGLYPPGSDATRSYLRFYNTGATAATVTASLLNGDTGAVVSRWTSSAIGSKMVAQFSINDLEAAADPGFVRPTAYGLRIEPETTMFGVMQHVLFNAEVGALTNASSCGENTDLNPSVIPFIYSSLFPDFVSVIRLENPSAVLTNFSLNARRAAKGTLIGEDLKTVASRGEAIISISEFEERIRAFPSPTDSVYTAEQTGFQFFSGYTQNAVVSRRAMMAADMTVVCNLNGRPEHTIATPLFTGNVTSDNVVTGQSFLRYYNSGASPGPVTVVLHDPDSGVEVGRWASPIIPVGASYQHAIATVEDAAVVAKKSRYTVTVESNIDGYFQHLLYRAPDGALSNFSVCAWSTAVDGAVLFGVHSSLVDAAGYPSTIIINNTTTSRAVATLDVIDGRNGQTLGTYRTQEIAGNGQAKVRIIDMERDAGFTPGAGVGHYVVKLRGTFRGFLQHFVENRSSGVVSDLTAMCAL